VTQLFPEGHVIDLHPWEHNEVPVVLGAALSQKAHIVALHLTRPAVTIPDRAALGMDSHFAAAKGAYLIRDFKEGKPKAGTVFVQGTMTTANLVSVLPEIEKAGLNVKIVAVISPQLFALQDKAYRDRIAGDRDLWDGMVITNRARKTMGRFIANPVAWEYSMGSDWDDRWRTGGTVDEVVDEAHLGPKHILQGIERFVRDRAQRIASLESAVASLK
jgi:transketolase